MLISLSLDVLRFIDMFSQRYSASKFTICQKHIPKWELATGLRRRRRSWACTVDVF
jgi:hypothetical protein